MESVRFEDLQLDDRILRAVADMGFEEASPIQAKSIPVQLEGVDMIGQAQTGTGKTAAFGIPLLQKIDPKNKKLQAVALCPTRELAIQVAEEIRSLAKYMHGIKVLPIYGGQDIVRQIKGLKDGTQIIIGTPGRVMDHMRRKTVKFDQVHTVIMDEADAEHGLSGRHGNYFKSSADRASDDYVFCNHAAGNPENCRKLPEGSSGDPGGKKRADGTEGDAVLL
mgnify:CR=1 FL=1